MNASLQFFDAGERVAILRVHPDGITFPGTFTFSVVVTVDGDEAKIHAAVRPPTKDERDAMRQAVLSLGCKRVTWVRRHPKTGALVHKARVGFSTSAAAAGSGAAIGTDHVGRPGKNY